MVLAQIIQLYAPVDEENFAEVTLIYDPESKVKGRRRGEKQEFAMCFLAPYCIESGFELDTMPLRLTIPKNELVNKESIENILANSKEAKFDDISIKKIEHPFWLINTEHIKSDEKNYYFSVVGVHPIIKR